MWPYRRPNYNRPQPWHAPDPRSGGNDALTDLAEYLSDFDARDTTGLREQFDHRGPYYGRQFTTYTPPAPPTTPVSVRPVPFPTLLAPPPELLPPTSSFPARITSSMVIPLPGISPIWTLQNSERPRHFEERSGAMASKTKNTKKTKPSLMDPYQTFYWDHYLSATSNMHYFHPLPRKPSPSDSSYYNHPRYQPPFFRPFYISGSSRRFEPFGFDHWQAEDNATPLPPKVLEFTGNEDFGLVFSRVAARLANTGSETQPSARSDPVISKEEPSSSQQEVPAAQVQTDFQYSVAEGWHMKSHTASTPTTATIVDSNTPVEIYRSEPPRNLTREERLARRPPRLQVQISPKRQPSFYELNYAIAVKESKDEGDKMKEDVSMGNRDGMREFVKEDPKESLHKKTRRSGRSGTGRTSKSAGGD